MSDTIYVLVLALALSLDAFVCAFAYGTDKIKMPFMSVTVIVVVCTIVLAASMWVGSLLLAVVPVWLALWLSFAILFILGALRLMDGLVKRMIRRHASLEKQLSFNMFGLSFILRLYADPARADLDSSKTISPGEAAVLAVSLSLDSVAIGISAAFVGVYMIYLLVASFAATALALVLGLAVGGRVSRSLPVDVSSMGGAVLIILAFARLAL